MPPLKKFKVVHSEGYDFVTAYNKNHAKVIFLDWNTGMNETDINKIEKQL